MPTRNVVLTGHQVSMIERLVKSGRYQNASEVLRDGLRLIESKEMREIVEMESLRVSMLAENGNSIANSDLQDVMREAKAARDRMAPLTTDDILSWRDEGRA